MATRRSVLGAGIAVASTSVTGAALLPLIAARGAEAADTPAPTTSTAAPAVELFKVPMPLIPVARPVSTAGGVDTYESTTRKITKEILPGIRTELLTYDGLFPGATIRARRNRPVVLVQHNGLDVPISRHLHGASVAQDSDGGPMDTIAPGDRRVYHYPNKQPHASLWYHDHAHHVESENVYRGLHGSYLLGDTTEDALPLPRGRYDVLIALRDVDFDASGELLYAMGDRNRNTLLVNGAPYPYFEVAARKYRLRFANTSNMRFFELRLADGGDLIQIGSDGGLLPSPNTTKSVYLSSGERADVVIDFSRYPVGTRLVLHNTAGRGPVEQVGQVMRFDVTRTAEDPSSVPSVLRTLAPLPAPTNSRTVVLRMDEDGRPDAQAYMDDKVYDPERVDAVIRHGASEVWTVTNANTKAAHNFHMHLVQFRVLERGGAAAGPAESGLKDTVVLQPGETVRLQATFDTYAGEFVYHCHMLDHSAMGMMATMKIG
ncbi:multicopper oxidase family protein (plasmid) [Streptomyces sp. NBC_01450]|uniref:multicopper oxidase domain-containing protein n=1 Tax=Streptomyces sp. NBC_01450 TaxID=2903871 RepID=UPI002E3102EE|nr:multicopper oxidase domain-containing protein [Streptomyces sp. NBC_01450]